MTYPVNNTPLDGFQTFQGTAAEINTTADDGFGSSNIITVEDGMQLTVPDSVSGVAIVVNPETWNYTLDKGLMAAANNSITFDAVYYSPLTGQESKVLLTLSTEGEIVDPPSPPSEGLKKIIRDVKKTPKKDTILTIQRQIVRK